MRRTLLVLLLVSLVIGTARQFELSLTGFVEFDWKTVEIVLVNEENKIEARAQPTETGFFLVPVLQRKNYRLQARSTKKNIKFAPEAHEISLKGKSEADALSVYDSATFNFKFAGFSLHSSVKIQGQTTTSEGSEAVFSEREGISIKLLRDNNLVKRAITNQYGEFTFEDIEPGQYVIKADEPIKGGAKLVSPSYSCSYSIEKGPICTGEISIVGTKFVRSVTLETEPLQAGTLHIRAANSNLLKHCIETSRQLGLQVQKGFDCAYKILKGSVLIPDLPHGQYEISVHSSLSVLKLSPSVIKVSHPISQGDKQQIELTGFFENLAARTLTVGQTEIADAEVKLNGQVKGKTDASGQFVFDRLSFGQQNLEIRHPHYEFPMFSERLDLDSYSKLQTIIAQKYAICGKIDFKNDPETAAYEVTVQLDGASSKDSQTVALDKKGSYCFLVPPGTYVIRPSVILRGKQMPVIPKQRTVTLKSTPMLNSDFSREQLVIKGSVDFQPNTSQKQKQTTEIVLLSADHRFVRSVALDSHGSFEFNDLLEDGYALKITNPTLCFAKDAFGPNEYAAHAVRFVQKGIQLQYQTEVSFKAKVGSHVVSFEKSRANLCLPVMGKLKIEVDDTFLFKKGMNSLELDTALEETLNIRYEVEKVKVVGNVRFDTTSISRFEGLSTKLQAAGAVQLSIRQGDSKSVKVELAKTGQANVWRYTTYLAAGARFQLGLDFSQPELAERLLVNPAVLQVETTDVSDLAEARPEIAVQAGSIINVKLSKEVKDLSTRILWRSSSSGSWSTFQKAKKSGESFVVAPVDSNYEYDLKVKKVGYLFTVSKNTNKLGDLIFSVSVSKTSELVVKIKGDHGKPLAGVSVYLTSMNRENFLKTTITSDSKGVVRKTLPTGSYFTKFVSKEYEFNPAQHTFTIAEGKKTVLKVAAKRTRFSVFGSVRHFGGSFAKDVHVEATCEDRGNEMVEEGLTDAEGNFVIKGLIPGKKYSIRVKAVDNLISMPDSKSLLVQPEDTANVHFILAKEWSLKSVKGKIILKDFSSGESKSISPLRVVLKELNSEASVEDNNDSSYQVETKLYGRRTFEFANLKKSIKKFELQVYTKQTSSPVYTSTILAEDLQSGLTVLPNVVLHKAHLTDRPESNLHIVSLIVTVAILVGLLVKFRK